MREGSSGPIGLFLVLVDWLARNEFVLLVNNDDVGPGLCGLYVESICFE